MRGPVVYCAEWPDYKDKHVLNLILSDQAALKSEYHPEILGGVVLLKGEAKSLDATAKLTTVNFTAIPYYSWANRGPGEMEVWIDAK